MGDTIPTPQEWTEQVNKMVRSARVSNDHFHIIAARLLNNVALSKALDRLYGELGLPEAAYEELKEKSSSRYQFLKAMLAEWVSLKSSEATWNELWIALKIRMLNTDAADLLEALFLGEIFKPPPPKQVKTEPGPV